MIVFGLVVAALLSAGTFVATTLWRRLDSGDANDSTLERVTAGAVLGIAFWIASSWALALTHTLTRTALWVLAIVVIVAGVASAPRLPRIRVSIRSMLLLLPVLAWTLFALWRGAILPPASHDALSYHLPRAVLMARAGGFEHFPSPDSRLNTYPANYELLLADVVLMSGTDDLTEWVSTAMFVLFLLATAALTRRWWPRAPAIAEVVIATATTPILLLHSSAHKNDVMAAAFALTAILWGARWYVQGGRMPMLLLATSLVLGGGTKPQVAAVLLGLTPFLLARAIRELRAGRLRFGAIAITAIFAIGLFAVGGAAPYVGLMKPAASPTPTAGAPPFAWGDFENLWQFPILLWLAPFSSSPLGVWVPWRHEYWFWPRYEIFFSHWGALFSVLVLLIPFGVVAARRDEGGAERRERFLGTMATLLSMAIVLPAEIRPVGFSAALGRYLLFVIPVALTWAIPPVLDALRRTTRFARLPKFFAVLLVLVFAYHAIDYAISDRFTPLAYVRFALSQPGTRLIWFEANRAASVADRMAEPNDTIAISGAFDTWIQPAFGAKLTRDVILLPGNATAAGIPDRAEWVVIDRSWNAIWGNPNLTHMGKFWRYIGRGTLPPEDVALYEQLLHDPRFRLVYHDTRLNQAVFWRIGSSQPRVPAEWRGER